MVKSEKPAFLGGDRWDAKTDFPDDSQILHYWKIVRPYQKYKAISEEEDAFRIKINDSLGQQMNIYSKIKLDSIVTRRGNLFYFSPVHDALEPSELGFRELDEKAIDSVTKSWRLYYITSNR